MKREKQFQGGMAGFYKQYSIKGGNFMSSTNKHAKFGFKSKGCKRSRPGDGEFQPRSIEIIDGLVGHHSKDTLCRRGRLRYVWDTDVAEYVKSETKARGEIGPQGPKGEQGPRGRRAIPA